MTRRGRADASPPAFRGHKELRAALSSALARETLPATVLIHGMPGCGKQSLALWLARIRLCT
ncbi:MAG: replication-associated recombination protein A, partial [Gemmatimonadetes bacterium]|nr:replication-associated recombination protein A [Gemmatimonadota bacterium]